MGGRGERIKTPISLQDLRRRIYVKAKADFGWTRWNRAGLHERLGLYADYQIRYIGLKVAPVR